MDKLLKIIWLVIGIMLLILIPFILKEKFRSDDYPEAYDQSLIVGEDQKQAIKDGKMIQGLIYDRICRSSKNNIST